jgi:hypothetical protein
MTMRTSSGSTRFVLLTLVAATAACNGALERLPEADVDASQKAIAQRIATKIYESCKSGQHEALGEEAIPEMREALSPEKQKATCQSVGTMFGDYVSIDYAETWKSKVTSFRVYRFKGHFSKSSATPEIRVVLDSSGKLSGFWLKPWTETPR